MNFVRRFYFMILLLFAIFANSQNSKQIYIEHAGVLTINEDKYPGARILTRDDASQVHIIHEGIDLWCNEAIQYKDDNFIEAYGDVKMLQGDSIQMQSRYIEYNGKTQQGLASGHVILTDPNSKITTDTLHFNRITQQAYYRTGGTVVKDTSGTITSKIGRYYMNLKKYKFVENVILKSKESTIKTGFFDFYSDTGHAFMYGPSTITTPTSKTYCEKGFYDTKLKIGYALKNAQIDYDNRSIEGDSLYFDDNRNFASASNHIKITDTINHSVVKGHYAEVYKSKDSLFITKHALAITVQAQDSIYIHADTLMLTGGAENRITRAFRNMKLYKSNMSAKADSTRVNHATGHIKLINIYGGGSKNFSTKRKPILWHTKSQITGDTIHIHTNPKTEHIDSLVVFENAFLISRDTLDAGYNQISGKHLIGTFDKANKLEHVDIIKNALSIYYLRNDANELIGIDRSKSGRIKIDISNNEIQGVFKYNQVDGSIRPESKYPDHERLLKGFDWREEEQPKSVESLFDDDPPLVLPIIKGLKDYLPQDDFFKPNTSDKAIPKAPK